MIIKMSFPINMEMILKQTGKNAIGQDYPIEMDGKSIGQGKIVKVDNFDVHIELDKDSAESFIGDFTKEELKSIGISFQEK